MKQDKLTSFINRMNRIGIDIKLCSNIPWVYINSINGKRVRETFQANHGFTIAFLPVKADKQIELTDIGETFKLIRKYITEDKDN
jgi:hypothetical protein